jgi:hypothetical protein
MFRIVVKSNFTMLLAVDLVRHINEVLLVLDKQGFQTMKGNLKNAMGKSVYHHKAC